jgi:formate hydrogenlyase transcriptional activator
MLVTDSGIDPSGTFQLAIEASPSGVLVADPEGRIVFVNRALERQFGYSREELIGQVADLLLPETLRPIHAAHREGLVHAPESRPTGAGRELSVRRKDGSRFSVEIGLNPLQTADGLFVLASIVDMTGRRRSEDAQGAALEEQLEFERFVAELSGQFINLPADQINDAIGNGLRRICEQVGLDRSTFYKIGGDGALVDSVSWTAPGVPLDASAGAVKRFPWSTEQVRAGEIIAFSTVSEIPMEIDRGEYRAVGTKSAVVVPLCVEGQVAGAVGFHTVQGERTWPQEVVHRLTVIASVFGEVLARQRRDQAVEAAAAEARRLQDQLRVENVYLRREAHERLGLTHVVGRSLAVRRVQEQIEQVAPTDSTVLLLGETGTGKELFATQIHELGARHNRAMVRVNCAAIPATLIESELFGREKGAYTGALARQVGRFELAHQSTIFLDEIGDLPPDVQVKLLRVLEERQIERLGSPRSITVDTRIIAATHRNLEQRIAEGTFREDLYYRLNVFPIYVPPLRDRVEDIPLLIWRFVEEFSKAFGKRIDAIDKDNLAALQQYSWPGNIRELRNVVERAMIVATHGRLTIPVPQGSAAATRRSSRLVDVEKEHIRGVLESTAWRIRGAGGAAERLGLKPTTLETRMAKLGITRPGHT